MHNKISTLKIFPIILLTFAMMACSGNKSGSDADTTTVTMYKNPGCQCCTEWATHLEENGFQVTEEPSPNMQAIKSDNDVPYDMGSCHTAIIGGYVVEGHVPAQDIKNLLEEQPDAKGLAVPNMPIGSPGMEMPGRPAEAYKVFLFKEDGSRQVYAQH